MDIKTKLDLKALEKGAQQDLDGLAKGPRRGILIEMSGSTAGRVHVLADGETTIGRGTDCTIMFDDTTLSRTHASIEGKDETYVLTDRESLNGCYVNLARQEKVALNHGDRVQFGTGVRLQFQLSSQEEQRVLVRMYEAAVLDGLTGLTNRRALDERLQSELAYAVRHESNLAIVMLDIDHFKKVNDTHGHLAGDEVIRTLAQILQREIRCEDLAARYGGEEFVVVVRGVPHAGAFNLAERLRVAIAERDIEHGDEILRVTSSFGVASLLSLKGEPTVHSLLDAADTALYAAKGGGRNRVESA
jgi:two-component system, cell cycle response regulator